MFVFILTSLIVLFAFWGFMTNPPDIEDESLYAKLWPFLVWALQLFIGAGVLALLVSAVWSRYFS